MTMQPCPAPSKDPPTPEELIKLQELLDGAVLGLFKQGRPGSRQIPSVFLTTIYSGLELIWAGAEVPTAGTNGLKLWINPGFFRDLSAPMRVTLLAHELWHVAFMHMERLTDRCPDKWNEACDHAINLMLKEYGYHFDISHLADEQFKGMSADAIYEVLPKDGPSDLPFGKDIVSSGGNDPGDPSNQPLTPQQLQDVLGKVVRAATVSKMSGDPPGSLPGELETKIEKLLNPTLPWNILLRRFFNELGGQEFSMKTPNRRHMANGMYLPGISSADMGLDHIVWACDASGSMSDEQLQVLNSEIRGVQDQFNPDLMTLIVFDTHVRTIEQFPEDKMIPPLTFEGRGGTDLQDLWAKVQEQKPPAKALVVFSDLQVSIPPAIPGLPILWVCMDNPGMKAPYGRMIHTNSA